MGFAVTADLTFLHGFEQGALRLGGGPVDLVGQQYLCEQRAGQEAVTLTTAQVPAHQHGQIATTAPPASNSVSPPQCNAGTAATKAAPPPPPLPKSASVTG